MRIHGRAAEERVHQTLKVTANLTSVFCGKEKWKEKNGTRLSVPQQRDSKRQLSLISDFQPYRYYGKKKGLYKNEPTMGLQQYTGERRR